MKLFAEKFSAGLLCFTVPRQWGFVRWRADAKGFRLARSAVLRQSAKNTAYVGTDFKLCRKVAEVFDQLVSLVLKAAASDALWSSPAKRQ